MFPTFQRAAALSIAAAVVAVATTSTHAVYLFNANGFESSTDYTVDASLEGQDLAHAPWYITSNSNPAEASVRSNVGVSGSKGVEVRAQANTTDTGWYVSKSVTPTTPFDRVNVDFSMAYVPTGVAGLSFGPFFGVELYDASLAGPAKQIGAFGVDSSTGDLLVMIDQGNGPELAELLTPVTVTGGANAFNRYGIQIDYTNQTYSISLNGTVLETNDFVDHEATNFTDAPIASRFISYNGQQQYSAGVAYFDDYSISIVPEPGTAALLGTVLLAARARRR